MEIRKVTVLGAGNMGSQIAALLVNAGLKVQLLDVVIDESNPNQLSFGAYSRITDKRKGLLYSPDFAGNLTYGNFNDDLLQENDSDLYIEAVSEDINIKHDLWAKVAKVAKQGAILTSNTSGIPIADVASVFDEEARTRFAGLHFFNPPRLMKLVEIIPHETTSQETLDVLKDFSTRVLGKGVVETKDVSGFVANRVGVYALVDVVSRAEKEGLSIEEVDALTGPVIGRPKTATYRLLDLVGVDIAYHVAEGMLKDPEQEAYYSVPESMTSVIEKGFLGNKVKQGYYKREGKEFFVYDYKAEDYRAQAKADIPFLKTLDRNLTASLKKIFEDRNDKYANFLWTTLENIMYYSAINVPAATEDYKAIDRAMVWGYNWKLGPFQMWDAIGFDAVKSRLKERFGTLPTWIEERTVPFYEAGESLSPIKGLKNNIAESVWEHDHISSLYEAKNGSLIFVLRTPNNTVTHDFAKDLIEAVNYLNHSDHHSMVVYSEGANFSLGANVGDMSQMIKDGKVDTEIAALVDTFQAATSAMKYSEKPIVTAVRGRALGGGAELVLHSPFVVAAAESYIGLVEVGVGVIPSGGGLSELAERIYRVKRERAEELALLKRAFETVIFAKVSKNAFDARANGMLRDTDVIIQNEELVLEAALEKAAFEGRYNYIPASQISFPVQGSNFRALAIAQLDTLVAGDFATDYERTISIESANVLSGGNVPLGTIETKADLLNLEKQGFLKLCKEEKTLERMEHMLKTKKILRN